MEADVAEPLILDLFAGAGGWEEGLRDLGHRALGVEQDRTASETATAAGHERLIADVAALDPQDFAPLWGLIASPPCQAYSVAGHKLGRRDKRHVIACAHDLAAGRDTRASRLRACEDDRSLLTVEPLRFALALRPSWVALEQVPPVAELWSIFAELLGEHGYSSAVGVLSAERYGVPQVRKRAFLIASIEGEVKLPEPTHRSFNSRRHRTPEDELHLPQWVSMAEALGWDEPAVLRSNHTNSGRHPGGAPRSLDRPAFTLMSSSRAWKIEPAPSRGGGPSRRAKRGPERSPEACRRHSERRANRRARDLQCEDAPAWAHRRPSTTLVGDPRVLGPGSWPRNGAPFARVRGKPVRVTVEQATVLQGFRHDYPWQGSRAERFTQIGNAVCPPVAVCVLREAIRPSVRGRRGGEGR
jgi:DNA (cytosine-5)-methyltransferase 1